MVTTIAQSFCDDLKTHFFSKKDQLAILVCGCSHYRTQILGLAVAGASNAGEMAEMGANPIRTGHSHGT